MIHLVTLPLGLFFSVLVYGLWLATDIETDWKEPPYDWNREDPELWLTEPATLDYQRREA